MIFHPPSGKKPKKKKKKEGKKLCKITMIQLSIAQWLTDIGKLREIAKCICYKCEITMNTNLLGKELIYLKNTEAYIFLCSCSNEAKKPIK